jgi:hypothetical protein
MGHVTDFCGRKLVCKVTVMIIYVSDASTVVSCWRLTLPIYLGYDTSGPRLEH